MAIILGVLIPADTRCPIKQVQIDNTLEEMQKLVGGQIETTDIPEELEARGPVTVFFNESKAFALRRNDRAMKVVDHDYLSKYIYGDFVIFGFDPETGDSTDSPLSTNDVECLVQHVTML
jgi:Domain of unknown function (DUF3846)